MFAMVITIIATNDSKAYAEDVWVTKNGDYDVYVVTETIERSEDKNIYVNTKKVINNRLVNLDKRMYLYDKRSQMWWVADRYRRDLRPTRVWEGENDPILGFCLNYLR